MLHAVDLMPQDILAEIGKIIAWWGYIQFQLGVIIREIAEIPKDTGRVLTIGPDIIPLCKMLSTFTENDRWVKEKSLRESIRKFANEVQNKADHRNDYAHGIFGYDDKKRCFVRHLMKTRSNRIQPQIEAIKVEDLKKYSGEARVLWEEAEKIIRALKVWNTGRSSPSK